MMNHNLFGIKYRLWIPIALSLLLRCGLAEDRLDRVASGKGKIIDLTYPLNEKTPYWPGEKYSPFKFETIATIKDDGVFSGKISMPEHIGTHLDAPNHFVAEQLSVDEIPIQRLFGPAVVIDIVSKVRKDPDYRLSPEDIKRWERAHGSIPPGSIVFLHTGWGRFWNNFDKYKNQDANGVLHFPGFSGPAATFLVKERNVRGLGIDTLSVDYGPSKDFVVHHITHKAGRYHIENVANLAKLPAKGAFIIVAPIKVEGGSGGPARVFALIQ